MTIKKSRALLLLTAISALIGIACAEEEPTLTLPVWTQSKANDYNAPAPQATACATPGQIALAYCEGPTDVTAKVLNGLKAAQAKANFFVNASWLNTTQYAMILQRAYNDGHLIGMTYRPPGDTSEGLTDEEIQDDVFKTAKAIEEVIGVAPKYVRLHYTEPEDIRLEHILYDSGYTLIGYNLDTMDYNGTKNNPSAITHFYNETFSKQLDTYDAKGSFISIQYDIPETGSSEAVSDVIKTIDEAGYTMVRLDGCIRDRNPYKHHAESQEFVNDQHSWGETMYKSGQVVMSIADVPFEASGVKIKDEKTIKEKLVDDTSRSASQSQLITPPMTRLYSVLGVFLVHGLFN